MIGASFSLFYFSPFGPLEIRGNSNFVTEIKFLPSDFHSSRSARDLRGESHSPLAQRTLQQLEEYFSGKRKSFELPMEQEGTPFQKQVWRQMEKISFGKTKTYSQIAGELGRPKAARAVGGAAHRNSLPIFIPCHRVVGVNEQLVGFAGGLYWKKALLGHEKKG